MVTVTAMYAGSGMTAWRRHGRAAAYLARHIDLLRVSSALCTTCRSALCQG
jgi:hypothetical protein